MRLARPLREPEPLIRVIAAERAAMGFGTEFECSSCGSPVVTLPTKLSDIAMVRCAACHAEIGTWYDFKKGICGTLRRLGVGLSADPIMLPHEQISARSEDRLNLTPEQVSTRGRADDRRVER